MKTTKRILSVILTLLMLFGTVSATIIPASAEESKYGYLSYEIIDNEVTITDCDENITGEFIIPEKIDTYPVTEIGLNAFYGCRGLTNVIFPNTIRYIGKSAFSDCSNLTSVYLQEGLEYIDECAFLNCDKLHKVLIPESVTYIGSYALGCENHLLEDSPMNDCDLEIYCYPNSEGARYAINYCFQYEIINWYKYENLRYTLNNGEATIIGYDFDDNDNAIINDGSVIIPDKIKNYPVTSIGENAFSGFEIESITISASVTSIDMSAFEFCSKLSNIYVSENNPVFDSRNNCNAIIETKSNKLLLGATNTIIPDSVKSIGSCAFCGNDNLTNITIPNSVTVIEESAFAYCTNLTSVSFSDSLVSIRDCAFDGCNISGMINLPDSIQEIGEFAFFMDEDKQISYSVVIPKNVKTIGVQAFGYYIYPGDVIDDEDKLSNFKIYCYTGTAGEQYAIDNGFDYELINDEPATYTITYNANGGAGAPAQQTKTQDVALTLSSSVPSREGYKFLGWADNQSAASAQYKSGASFTKNADTTLYAVWSPVSYTVKFFDGANLLGSKTLKYGETGTLSYGAVPSKSGFKFTGWSTFDGGVATLKNGQEIKNLSSADGAVISYYAAWKAVENKTVTDGATGVSVTASEDTYNGNMTLKVEKVLSGSSFDILETVDDVVEKSEVFSIETYVDGVKTQPNGYVTVKIPVPSGFDKTKCELYYINTATKKAEPISFTFEGNYIVFKTNHFSDWAIVQTAGKVKSVKVDNITLNYKKSAVIKPQITADSGVKYTVTYESSNPKAATVDKDGKVYAAKKGAADIKVTVTDEYGNKVTDTCKVTVKYSFGQWLIIILLFGWIWY